MRLLQDVCAEMSEELANMVRWQGDNISGTTLPSWFHNCEVDSVEGWPRNSPLNPTGNI